MFQLSTIGSMEVNKNSHQKVHLDVNRLLSEEEHYEGRAYHDW